MGFLDSIRRSFAPHWPQIDHPLHQSYPAALSGTGWNTDSGVFDRVTAGTDGLHVAPVYAAVALIADTIATLPVATYRRKPDDARERVADPTWLATPDPRITRVDWIVQALEALLLRGNAYGLVAGNPAAPDGVIWLPPERVHVDESGPRPLYQIGASAERSITDGGRILHVRALLRPGTVVGVSPLQQFRAQMTTAAAATAYGAEWFRRAHHPTALLTSKAPRMSTDMAREARELFRDAAHEGLVVLPTEFSYETISIAPDEAQFLQTIKATATQIASIYRVPPEEIGGETGGSLTYSTVEGNALRFAQRTLLPWTVRLEHALAPLMPADQYVRFNLDASIRTTTLDRARANTEALRNGTLTLDEARALEDRRPLTPAEIDDWQQWFTTTKSQSEALAESVSTSITHEAA